MFAVAVKRCTSHVDCIIWYGLDTQYYGYLVGCILSLARAHSKRTRPKHRNGFMDMRHDCSIYLKMYFNRFGIPYDGLCIGLSMVIPMPINVFNRIPCR